jgi:hypothetical protein
LSDQGLSAIRAPTAAVGGFPLFAVLVYVAHEHPAFEASAGALQASVPSTKRSPDDARWHLQAPDLLTRRNSLLRSYPEGAIATGCPSKDRGRY